MTTPADLEFRASFLRQQAEYLETKADEMRSEARRYRSLAEQSEYLARNPVDSTEWATEMTKRSTALAPQPWTMPSWMEPYRGMIGNTGGNSVEELVNDDTTTVFENAPRAVMAVEVQSQVDLLLRLHREGKL